MSFPKPFSIAVILFLLFVVWLSISLVPSFVDENVSLKKTTYSQLDGWQDDTQGNALLSFRTSCELFLSLPSGVANVPKRLGGEVDHWTSVCVKAHQVLAEDHQASRKFFEENFTAFNQ